MSVKLTLELTEPGDAQIIDRALESYQARLQADIARTQRRLREFEQRYQVTTDQFLATMSAEDLVGGDIEYVEWAGEAKLLHSLEGDLRTLTLPTR